MNAGAEIATHMKAWRLHEYGAPSDVLQQDEVEVPTPEAGELLVRVQAAPLNLNDLDRVTGANMMVRPDLPYAPGMEVLGVVAACGPGAEARQGERVVATTKGAIGGFAEYAICPSVSAFAMPSEVPFPDAAALYFPFHLAWLGLYDRAELAEGESVLIHAAAGGSGSAAIQLAKARGATVFATVGSAAKIQVCKDLGADFVINYNEEDFGAVVMENTANRGVDVVFDNVGDSVFEASLNCTAYNGRYLMMGFASDKSHADEKWIVPRRVATGNLKLCGVLLSYAPANVLPVMKKGMGWNFAPSELGQRIHQDLLDRLANQSIRPLVGRVAGFHEVPAALEDMAARRTVGRTVVQIDGDLG